MALNHEKRSEVVKTLLLGGFWFSDCEEPLSPDGRIINFENFRLLKEQFDQIPDEEFTLDRIYKLAIDLRKDGHLIRKIVQLAPPPIDPADTLPHDDIKELRNVRNLADVKRIVNLPKEELKQLANLKPGSPSFKELNERLAYIREHQLGKGEKPTVVDKTEQSESENSTDGGYSDARAIVESVTNKDVGSVGSAPGQGGWDKANRFKERVGRIIDGEERKGTSGPAVLKWVKQELANLQSSSTR